MPRHFSSSAITRRSFITGIAGASALIGLPSLALGRAATGAGRKLPEELRGNRFDLSIGYQTVNFTGRDRLATTVNGTLPGPLLRWKQGDTVSLRVRNQLADDASIHWHGIILPTEMDGVPGLSFAGIKPGEYYDYRFTVQQHGTYWYHSHSAFHEQTGLYGAIVIDPANGEEVVSDRDYVVMLSDWSDEDPHHIYKTLKRLPHYYNTDPRTLKDLYNEIRERGVAQTLNEREMWNRMRMSDRDLSDVTGYTYSFLMNGSTPDDNWTALFRKGEKVRLRFINAAAMTIFDVRVPGLKLRVISADGQNIDPVSVDEFRLAPAETCDLIVEPESDTPYTLFAQAIDRSGFARGTLTPDTSLTAQIPQMDPPPVLSHLDMGMGMAGHSHGTTAHENHAPAQPDHAAMNHAMMDHSAMGHNLPENVPAFGTGSAGFGSSTPISHARSEFGPQVDMRAEAPQYRLDNPGVGLRDHLQLYGRRVLTYADLRNRYHVVDHREPQRELQLHLTGNMARYMWSVDGISFADAEPLQLQYGERLRITLVNDTMMNHPIHLHGMWSELETGDPMHLPRKHTVIVQPGTKISYLVTADAKGRWAYHCHLLYHMLGMFREVQVS